MSYHVDDWSWSSSSKLKLDPSISTSTSTFNFNSNTHEPYMILKALNKIYKIISGTLLSTLHCSGEIKLWKFCEVWTQNSNNFNLVKHQLCTFISPSWSWSGLSYFAMSFNSIRTRQLQSLSPICHVLGYLEFSAQLCIFWTPKNRDFGPQTKKSCTLRFTSQP